MTTDAERLAQMGTDAEKWAQEFVRIFEGCTVVAGESDGPPHWVDEGTMIGWFANLIQAVRDEDAAK